MVKPTATGCSSLTHFLFNNTAARLGLKIAMSWKKGSLSFLLNSCSLDVSLVASKSSSRSHQVDIHMLSLVHEHPSIG